MDERSELELCRLLVSELRSKLRTTREHLATAIDLIAKLQWEIDDARIMGRIPEQVDARHP